VSKDLPPKSTLFSYFDLWNWGGTLGRIYQELYVKCREAMGARPSPRQQSLTARASKARKKGALHRPVRV
jgi:hypothetical protein